MHPENETEYVTEAKFEEFKEQLQIQLSIASKNQSEKTINPMSERITGLERSLRTLQRYIDDKSLAMSLQNDEKLNSFLSTLPQLVKREVSNNLSRQTYIHDLVESYKNDFNRLGQSMDQNIRTTINDGKSELKIFKQNVVAETRLEIETIGTVIVSNLLKTEDNLVLKEMKKQIKAELRSEMPNQTALSWTGIGVGLITGLGASYLGNQIFARDRRQ